MPAIDFCFDQVGWSPSDLDAVVVDIGPGVVAQLDRPAIDAEPRLVELWFRRCREPIGELRSSSATLPKLRSTIDSMLATAFGVAPRPKPQCPPAMTAAS